MSNITKVIKTSFIQFKYSSTSLSYFWEVLGLSTTIRFILRLSVGRWLITFISFSFKRIFVGPNKMVSCATFILPIVFYATTMKITLWGVILKIYSFLPFMMTTTSMIDVSSPMFATSSDVIIVSMIISFYIKGVSHKVRSSLQVERRTKLSWCKDYPS